ncbi:MAG: hypothetical protein A2Y10_07485 [Planctomycetes bacterium GWF2_41_51]|nr:MAG: hypothetical protein A2Y10_07485 [Planctomycetes bacterium GWF2_41_51]HBG27197.1 hypothetical protein [Phycisphaerales bacterium]
MFLKIIKLLLQTKVYLGLICNFFLLSLKTIIALLKIRIILNSRLQIPHSNLTIFAILTPVKNLSRKYWILYTFFHNVIDLDFQNDKIEHQNHAGMHVIFHEWITIYSYCYSKKMYVFQTNCENMAGHKKEIKKGIEISAIKNKSIISTALEAIRTGFFTAICV